MIIDSHVHLITHGMAQAAFNRMDKMSKGAISRRGKSGPGIMNRDFIDFLGRTEIAEFARIWVEELDKNRVDRALFLPIGGAGLDEMDQFTSLHPDRFSAYMMPDDPTEKKVVQELEKLVKSGRFVGIKLYPCVSGVSVADERAFPLYEAAGALDIPILIHFGITMAPIADYRLTNPMDLMLPSRMFSETNFIIAHFGAGFFREVLLLGFHAKNIYVDTSGTNNWRMFLPRVMELSEIFKRAIEVYGAERILFGTDTILNGKTGYRDFVLAEQLKALDDLALDQDAHNLIMGGNAARLFGLGEL
ncbi:MAG: amidohydrolase family protein [Nitrospinota bacterium]|nr:amidohydrolase family protein [Nitrospinota bacterium]